MNIGVVGSRRFNWKELMYEILDVLDPFVLVSGGAEGADSLACQYATSHDYPTIIHLPDWEQFGRSAGFRRNRLIVDDSDLVLAFWDGSSPGTKSTIDICKATNTPVEIIVYPSI